MMMPYHREDAAKRLERRAHFFPNNRMFAHDPGFFRVQRPGLQKDVLGHRDFPYVVKPAGHADFLQVLFSKTKAFSQLLA